MAGSGYKVIDSSAPARNPGRRLSPGLLPRRPGSRRDLRIVEVGKLDLQIEDGQVKIYRAKVKVSFESRNRP